MAAVTSPTRAVKTKARFQWRVLLRALHRDMGYLVVGLTFIYALSGLAVNHIADWDPNFRNYETAHELGPIAGEPDAVAAAVAAKLGIREAPREVYAASDDAVEVLFDRRTLHVNPKSGHVIDEGQKPRFLLRVANWLHLNRGKKAWRYIADAYATILLLLSFSGMFMIKGPKGIVGRGAVLVGLGISLPILYVALAGGP
jgi:hypothetical protein